MKKNNNLPSPTDVAGSQHEGTDSTNVSTSKRALLTKGWIVPVIVGVSLPTSGFAANISADEEFPGN